MRWNKDAIASAIVAASSNGYCKTTVVGMTVATMARRVFGSFEAACRYAGVQAWSMRAKHTHCTIEGCNTKARSRYSHYCEKHFYRIRRNGTLCLASGLSERQEYSRCQHCGIETGGKKYCSQRCGARDRRGCDRTRECVYCGIAFKPYQKNVCCSDGCAHQHSLRLAKVWRTANAESLRPKQRAAEYKRKALKAATAHEEIDREYIFQRDKYRCKLCHTPVKRNAKWPDPLFPTLDHIIPLSKGGPHTKANVQCAHLRCNVSKSNRARGEQLLLLG